MRKENELKIDYHHWANTKLLKHMMALEPEIFSRKVKSIFPSISTVFSHIYQVDRRWLKRIMGISEKAFEEITFPSPENALQQFEVLYKEYKQLDFDVQTISYQNTKGEVFKNHFHDIIQHVMNHGTYHRGNASAILHQMGQKSISTDYIFFLRDKKILE